MTAVIGTKNYLTGGYVLKKRHISFFSSKSWYLSIWGDIGEVTFNFRPGDWLSNGLGENNQTTNRLRKTAIKLRRM